jgi:DNA uptake protein ComE-like DNA-binding protein
VEILGDVKRPGVLLVDGPATVGGALAAAGGCRSEAAANLPLAAAEQAITSGVRLWVECPPGGTVSVRFALIEPAALITLGVRLDINHAEPAALLLVPGMQSEFAAAIVKRRLTKPWERLDQLAEIPGVGPKTVKKWEKYLEVGAAGEKLQPPP